MVDARLLLHAGPLAARPPSVTAAQVDKAFIPLACVCMHACLWHNKYCDAALYHQLH